MTMNFYKNRSEDNRYFMRYRENIIFIHQNFSSNGAHVLFYSYSEYNFMMNFVCNFKTLDVNTKAFMNFLLHIFVIFI